MGAAVYVRTNEDMNQAILYGLRKIPRDVDLIVGIPRSGLLAAMLFSLYLNTPVTDLQGLAERRLLATGRRPVRAGPGDIFDTARKILIVDDCVSWGTEMDRARRFVSDLGYGGRALFLAVYSFPEVPGKADIVLEVVPRPMAFQWSCMHSLQLAQFCVDIDGLLCVDATPERDDDGPRYADFLENAEPLFTPVVEIGWLVTCRLEKYRPQTERWMEKHGIRYRNLIMMDYPDKAAREADQRHAAYKAEVYRATGAELFIESSPDLAARIAELSGRPVLSYYCGSLYQIPASQRIDVLHQKARWWLRRFRRAPAWAVRRLGLPVGGKPGGRQA